MVKEKKSAQFHNTWETSFSFKGYSYIALRTYRYAPKKGTIKLINNHEQLSFEKTCVFYLGENDGEHIISFSSHYQKPKDYEVVGFFNDLTEEQCKDIVMISKHTDFVSYAGAGKRVFKTAKGALRSLQMENSIILKYKKYDVTESESKVKKEVLAKFMGGKEYYYTTGGGMRRKESMVSAQWVFPENSRKREYLLFIFSDWDWLMPVYHKIKRDFGKKLYPPQDFDKAFEKAYNFIKDNK